MFLTIFFIGLGIWTTWVFLAWYKIKKEAK